MPSKTSKPHQNLRSLWKEEPACSEAKLSAVAAELARELGPSDAVLLEGPLGAGKTTFAKLLLSALGITQLPEGSPTFAIAHEYTSPRFKVVHMDLYRLKSEAEIDEAGIPEYFQSSTSVVLIEWLSLWKIFEKAVIRGKQTGARFFHVNLAFTDSPDHRSVRIEKTGNRERT